MTADAAVQIEEQKEKKRRQKLDDERFVSSSSSLVFHLSSQGVLSWLTILYNMYTIGHVCTPLMQFMHVKYSYCLHIIYQIICYVMQN